MTSLVKTIDQRVDAAGKTNRTLGIYVIYIDNADNLDKQLRELAEKEGLKRVCLGIGIPPDAYEVAKEAEVTVVFYSRGRRPEQKVTANFAIRKGELTEAKATAIVQALSEVLPK